MGEARRRGATWEDRAIARIAPDSALQALPDGPRLLVLHTYQELLALYRDPFVTRLITGKALEGVMAEPWDHDEHGHPILPETLFLVRLRGHVQIWRSHLAPSTGRPPFGPQHAHRADGAKVHLAQVICRVCGSRWTVNADDPANPIAIGQVPVVGPIVQTADVPPGAVQTLGTVRCWVCVERQPS